MKKVLTIAGSDCSGGAGIQADLKTITAHKMYGMSAVTSLTAQNTTGVYGIYDVTSEFLASQLDCIFNDIYPDAVKIGMVSNKEIIKVIADKLRQYEFSGAVIDPVMVSTSGKSLLMADAVDALINVLLPCAGMITPNIPEAEVLSGIKINSENDMESAAEIISEKLGTKVSILIKGGHGVKTADDLLLSNGKKHWFFAERIENNNTHGTGCTLSSAIACEIADGNDYVQAVKKAKEYISGALKSGLDLGKGSGPLDHTFWLDIKK